MIVYHQRQDFRCTCNQKEGVLPTHSAIEPLTPNLILIYYNAYRPPSFSTLVLSIDSHIYTLRVINTQRQNRPLRTPSPAFLHSHAQIPAESIHITLQIIYTPKAQALFLDKFPKLQTFQSSSNLSLYPNFYSNDLTRTTRHSGKIRHSANIAQLQIFHHRYVHQNSAFLSSGCFLSHSSIPAAFFPAPYSIHSQKENNHALHAVMMGRRKTRRLI